MGKSMRLTKDGAKPGDVVGWNGQNFVVDGDGIIEVPEMAVLELTRTAHGFKLAPAPKDGKESQILSLKHGRR
jgi:hypothetical protein